MSYMFCDYYSLTNINLSNFNTNNINDMSGMLSRFYKLTKDNIIVYDKKLLNESKYQNY